MPLGAARGHATLREFGPRRFLLTTIDLYLDYFISRIFRRIKKKQDENSIRTVRRRKNGVQISGRFIFGGWLFKAAEKRMESDHANLLTTNLRLRPHFAGGIWKRWITSLWKRINVFFSPCNYRPPRFEQGNDMIIASLLSKCFLSAQKRNCFRKAPFREWQISVHGWSNRRRATFTTFFRRSVDGA